MNIEISQNDDGVWQAFLHFPTDEGYSVYAVGPECDRPEDAQAVGQEVARAIATFAGVPIITEYA